MARGMIAGARQRAQSQWRMFPPMLRYFFVFAVVMLVVASSSAIYVGVNGLATASLPESARATVIDPSLPGSIVEVEQVPSLVAEVDEASSRSARVTYRSTDARTGVLTEVSGSAFVPTGDPPRRGWPVVSVGNEAAGIHEGCASSLSSSLLGAAPLVAGLLRRGYAVAVTDYQWIGAHGSAGRYLDAATAGRNMIDAVRALRGTFPDVSAQWAAFGTAEGGGAAWAANQQAPSYAGELDLVGAVVLSPITDGSDLVEKATKGTLSAGQRRTWLWLLASMTDAFPQLNLDDYRHGIASQRWDALTACSGALVHEGILAFEDLNPLDLAPSTPEAADALRSVIAQYAVADVPLTAPLSVVYGDKDAVVDPLETIAAVGRSCIAKGTISWRVDRAAGRLDNDWDGQLAWLADRFAGIPAPNFCQSGSVSSPGSGSVISTEDIPDVAAALPPGSGAARVVYGSTDGDSGASTVVGGSVFTPAGPPPPGGWPVLALGHGTAGIEEGCGPSLSSDLLLQVPLVARILEYGYAVALSDYEGLGAPGIHRYLDSRTAGLNMIDSVRALRATFPDTSSRWAAFGGSQGAGAAWAADEQASTYAPDLELVGAIAMSPPADVTGMIDKAVEGTLTAEQLPALALILKSLSRAFPSMDVDQLRRGSAADNWDLLSTCSFAVTNERTAAVEQLQPSELAPASPQVADQLRWLLSRWALPQHSLAAPLSIVYGSEDRYIDAQWTTDAIARACALGDSMNFQLQPGKGHSDLDFTGQGAWLADRFAGLPIVNDCPTG